MTRRLTILAVTFVSIAFLESEARGQQPDVTLPDSETQPDSPSMASEEPKPELERPTV